MKMKRASFAIAAACAAILLAWAVPALAAPFSVEGFDGLVAEADGSATTQAGAHPFEAWNGFEMSTEVEELPEGEIAIPTQNVRNIEVEVPAGLVGNPQAVESCPNAMLVLKSCPADSQVGTAEVALSAVGELQHVVYPLYNVEAPPGHPAEFGFLVDVVPIYLLPEVRTGGDYGITFKLSNISQALPLSETKITFWGVPGDPAHTADRGYNGGGEPCASTIYREGCANEWTGGTVTPFVTNPSACSAEALPTFLHLTTWQEPGLVHEAKFISHDGSGNPVGVDGCDDPRLGFEPSVAVTPTSHEAGASTGLEVDLTVPQREDEVPSAEYEKLYQGSGSPQSIATPSLHTAEVTLPQGMTLNPALANGLVACSQGQIELAGPDPAACPNASKIGSAEIVSPLFDHPLEGGVYVAQQKQNKFGSLLATYVGIDDPATGTVVKLAGKIAPDPATGRLTATFPENPQLPFEEFKLRFFGGDDAALINPASCGSYQVAGRFSPWSAPTAFVDAGAQFAVDQNCSGGFAPILLAGSRDTAAGAFSPFTIKIGREESSQRISTISTTLPAGLLAKLAGVPYCPDATIAAIPTGEGTGSGQAASPSCPAASQVGVVHASVGAGMPFPVDTGKAYLAGPYKGAPLSVAAVVPALAGPFDLGNVVVRAALAVNPANAQVTVSTDPIPQFLAGIPLDLRALEVDIDRSQFTLNPTSCDPTAVSGSATSVQDTTAQLSQRFQVGGCANLGFKPKISLSLKGRTTRAQHPALTAAVSYPKSGAYSSIAKASVLLPHSEFLENAHLNNPCTKAQFAANACPVKSVYGHAVAYSPLLDKPLSGPIYLRTSSHGIPDLVAHLRGQITIDLVGRIDSVHQAIRTTFEGVPDAPVSKFVFSLDGGRKGLLVNSTNLCVGKHVATVAFDAHNGKVADSKSVVRAKCANGAKGGKKK
jgi:hypothetical protein